MKSFFKLSAICLLLLSCQSAIVEKPVENNTKPISTNVAITVLGTEICGYRTSSEVTVWLRKDIDPSSEVTLWLVTDDRDQKILKKFDSYLNPEKAQGTMESGSQDDLYYCARVKIKNNKVTEVFGSYRRQAPAIVK